MNPNPISQDDPRLTAYALDEMEPAERAEFNARILGDETTIGGMFDELSARFQVPAGKIPRRLVDAILRAAMRDGPLEAIFKRP